MLLHYFPGGYTLYRKYSRQLKYYILRLLRMRNSNHRIATGFAWGFFPCWYPTFGIGMVLSMVLTRVFRGNIPAAILAASLGSFIWPALFYLNYRMGVLIHLLGSSPETFEIHEAISAPVPETDYSEYTVETDYVDKFGHMGLNFAIGSIVNSIIFTFLIYLLLRIIFPRIQKPLLNRLRKSTSRKTGAHA